MRSLGPPHLSRALVSREQAHRRVLLLATGALLMLGLTPIVGHHLGGVLEGVLLGRDHLGALCLIALHALLAPVHGLFHLLTAAGLACAAWDRLRASASLRRTLASLDTIVPAAGDPFWRAAFEAGCDPARLRVVVGLPVPAFTAGWFAPRIYLAAELVERLPSDQLRAVLAHEAAHAERRDPLRLSTLRFLTRTLFWIPAFRRLADEIADEAEILADDAAAAGGPLVLAAAIVALAGWPYSSGGESGALRGAAVGFATGDLLERRVRRLLGDDPRVGRPVPRSSFLGAVGALMLMVTSSAVMVHPLPAQARHHPAQHCDHPEQSALAHLFCLTQRHSGPASGGCPHTHRG